MRIRDVPLVDAHSQSACVGLEKLFKDYSDKGLKVLGFPWSAFYPPFLTSKSWLSLTSACCALSSHSNQFGSQDKGT